jgi:hypothetical protein
MGRNDNGEIERVSDAYVKITKLIAETPDESRPALMRLIKHLITGIEYHEQQTYVEITQNTGNEGRNGRTE